MKVLSSKDYLEVTANSLIADYDRDILTNLYQPIFGYTALSVYFSLWSEMNNQKVTSISTHEQFLARMQMPTGVFVDARKSLEACGLLRTYVEAAGEVNVYTYELYAPKTPKLFFDNALLYGMLIKCIGENEAKRLKSIYKIDNENEFGEEISAHFHDVFHPEFDDPSFMIAAESDTKSIGRNSAKIRGDFSYETLFDELKKISQITDKTLSKGEVKEIERMALLYGVNEATAAIIISRTCDLTQKKGFRISMKTINDEFKNDSHFKYAGSSRTINGRNLINSKTDLAEKINVMETVSPADYLSLFQNYTKPAKADLNLLNMLSNEFHLENPVINVLVDYVLTVNNNILSKYYVEKIAASLARENVVTAIDAMNYLKKIHSPKASRKSTKITNPINELANASANTSSNNSDDELTAEQEFEKMMLYFNRGDKDGEN